MVSAAGLVVVLTAGLVVGSAYPAGAVAGYGDVPGGAWYTDAVQWSADNGIAGVPPPCFEPQAGVSRGETAVWIYNMVNSPYPGRRHSFVDVVDESQHDAVSWMSNTGVTTGTSATTFAPDDILTRAQAAAFLHRLAGEPVAPAHRFRDVVAGWQQAAVSWMSNTGITTGTSATTFAPDDTLTRAHLVTFLWRYQNEPGVTVDTASPHCDPSSGDDTADGGVATLRDHVVPPTRQQLEGLEARASRGDFDVLTFICASADKRFTLGFLDAEIFALNEKVASFFDHQSSETVQLAFSRGGIIDGINDSTGTSYGAKSGVPAWGHAFSSSDKTTRACEAEARAIAGSSNPYIYVFVDLPLGGLGGWAYFGGFATQPLRSFFQVRVGDPTRGSNAFYNTVAHEIGHSVFRLGHVHQEKLYYREGHSEKVYVAELADDPFDKQNKHASKCSIMSYCDQGTQYGVDTSRIWVACGQRELLGWPRGPRPPLGPACDFGPGEDLSVPSAPRALSESVVSEDSRIIVSWLAPSDDGGGIDEYRVTLKRSGAVVRTEATNALRIAFDSLENDRQYTIEIRAANEAGQSEPLVLTGTPNDSAATASVSSVSLYRGAPSIGCVNYQDIDDCAWFDIDVEFTEGKLPSSVTVTCHTAGFNNDRAWRTRTVNLNSDREELATGTSTELDRVCRYALPGNSVYVTVEGVASWKLEWGRPPDAPFILVPRSGDGQIQVNWVARDDNGSPITAYEVEWTDDGWTTWDSRLLGSTARSWTITGLENGDEYEVRVYAWNANGWSDGSSIRTATPAAGAQSPDAPDAPTLTPGDEEVTVEWVAPEDNGSSITGYRVYYRRAGAFFYSQRRTSSTQLTITGLENDTEYEFYVRAVNAEGVSDRSPIATETPTAEEAQVPDAPAAPTLTPDDGQVTVEWDEPVDNGAAITRYRVNYRATGTDSWRPTGFSGYFESLTSSTAKTITDLENGTEYEFRVRAQNSEGWSEWSEIATATPTADSQVPGAPGNLQLTAGDGQIRIEWDAPDDNSEAVAGYTVWFRVATDDDSGEWSAGNPGSDEFSWTATGLDNGVEYEVDVCAWHASGSGDCVSGTATPMADAQVPDAPDAPTLTPGDEEVIVEWDEPADNGAAITHYWVYYRRTGGGGGFFQASSTQQAITGLDNGTEYEFYVRAWNAEGRSDRSPTASITAGVPVAPDTPTARASDGQVVVDWEEPEDNGDDITLYRIYYRKAPGSWRLAQTYSASSTRITLTNLDNNSSYEFYVQAQNSRGLSGPSPTVTATPYPGGPGPEAPAQPTATAGDGQVALEWDEPDDNGVAITGYLVEWRKVGDSSRTTTWSSTTSKTVTGLEGGVAYEFRVRARDSEGFYGGWSPTVTATPS